ncbi:hypothetical protein OCT51_09515 [Halomonas sp. LR3S48]|uniref:hypothetical protein n=1 Tax=Halomonas sp. LR3S48 TaxID=2982694 RepID=UPI0021E417FF|nr:hypothetical protein [Halomonas sp. LR3S48]UYG05574.1 hypothetical protein OCT51_09515 [Halomonas sp. LR3S48]
MSFSVGELFVALMLISLALLASNVVLSPDTHRGLAGLRADLLRPHGAGERAWQVVTASTLVPASRLGHSVG